MTDLFPGYAVVEHLSRARAFDVFDVWSEERACRCIAKTLRPDRARDREARRALEREGRLLCKLTHPHVVRGYELVTSPRTVVVMETLSGETLSHLIEAGDPLSPSELAHLGLQLCSGVGYLHRNGVLHLDLKPSNVVAEAGRAKIIDLGVARRPGRAPGGVGTWCYMAPEQVRGGELGPAADVWGIGAVLWEAAAGRAAFGGDEDDVPASGDLEELPPELHPQLGRRAEPLSTHRRLPRVLARAIDSALEPEAGARPSVAELVQHLERVPGVVSPKSVRAGSEIQVAGA
jgi:eukaryotic-like serine/threonine-protein kinase